MESAIFINKHLCTLLSPGRFKAQIGFYVERLAGGALFQRSRCLRIKLVEVTTIQGWDRLQATSKVPWDWWHAEQWADTGDRTSSPHAFGSCLLVLPIHLPYHKARFAPLQNSTLLLMYFSRRYFFKVGVQFILTQMLECLPYTHLGFFLLGIAWGWEWEWGEGC